MSNSPIFQSISAQMSEYFGIPMEKINLESTFVELGLDSLALVEFSVVISENYGVELDDLVPDSTLAEATTLIEAELESNVGTV
jgi:acyl carrier protein